MKIFCSPRLKNQPCSTVFGELNFDEKGEAEIADDEGRKIIDYYPHFHEIKQVNKPIRKPRKRKND